MSAWKKIQERMAADKEFAVKIRDMMPLDDVIQYCEEVGFRFTDEELEELTELKGDMLLKVAGAGNPFADAPRVGS